MHWTSSIAAEAGAALGVAPCCYHGGAISRASRDPHSDQEVHMSRSLRSAAALLALLAAPASAQFIAVTFDGDILRVDPSTGIGTLEFSTGVQGMQGLSQATSGRLWAIQRATQFLGPRIWEIDTVLGLAASYHYTYIN